MYITTVFVRLIVVLSYDWSYGRHMTNRPTNFEVIYWLYVSYDQTMSNDSTAVKDNSNPGDTVDVNQLILAQPGLVPQEKCILT